MSVVGRGRKKVVMVSLRYVLWFLCTKAENGEVTRSRMKVAGGSGNCHSMTQGKEKAPEEMKSQHTGLSSHDEDLRCAQPMNRY